MITYDCDYEWGQGREAVVAELLDFAHHWEVNESRPNYDWHIWDGMYNFVKVGVCLKNLALGKIYKQKFRTFKQFCEKYLKISAGLAKQYIKASETWLELASATKDDEDGETVLMFDRLPQNISQTIPLTKLNPTIDIETGESELTKKWGDVITYTERLKKGKLTANAVKEIVDGPLPDKKYVVVDENVWSLINNQAAREGLSNKDFLKKIVKEYMNYQVDSYTEEIENTEPEYKDKDFYEEQTDEPKTTVEPESEPEIRPFDFLDKKTETEEVTVKPKKDKAKYPFYDLTQKVANAKITAIISNKRVEPGSEYLVVEKPRSRKVKGEIRVTKVVSKLVGELTTDDFAKMGFYVGRGYTVNEFIDYCKSFKDAYRVLDRTVAEFLNQKTRIEFIEFELMNYDYYSSEFAQQWLRP